MHVQRPQPTPALTVRNLWWGLKDGPDEKVQH